MKVKNVKFENEADEEESIDEKYGHIEHHHPEESPSLFLADPIFINPNSFKNVATVLRMIGMKAGISRCGGDQRKWTVVCSDGLPYNLMLKLIEESRCCSICDKSYFGDEIHKHFRELHPGETVKYYLEFDWVVIKIGGGHYEYNMTKSFFELNWVPYLSDLSYIMGFKSDAAQASTRKCVDNHKSWQLMLMFYIGSIEEMILPYVRSCMERKKEPTGEEFLNTYLKHDQAANEITSTYLCSVTLLYSLF